MFVWRTALAGLLRVPPTASRGKHDEGGRPAVCSGHGTAFIFNPLYHGRYSPAAARRPAKTLAAGDHVAWLSGRFCVLAKIAWTQGHGSSREEEGGEAKDMTAC